MKFKLLSLFLAASMALSMAACGGQAPASDVPEASGGSEGGNAADITFPLEKPINVTIASTRHDDYTEIGKTTVMQQAEKDTNIEVDWLDWPMSIKNEKSGLAFSGGSLPDAFYGAYLFSNTSIVKYGEQGYFVDFLPYIENGSMPNLSKLIERHPSILTDITDGSGHIYSLPAIQEGSGRDLTSDCITINKTWLEKVNKEVPTTTEELYDVLKAFKEAGDLNGNGKDDEIPLTMLYGNNGLGCWGLMGMFGTPGGTSRMPVVGKDGKLVFAQTTDDYKDFVNYFHRLYSEGLLDPECFTMDMSSYNAKTITGEPSCGVVICWSPYQMNSVITNGDEYIAIPPMKSDNGNDPRWQTRAIAYNRTPAFQISADSKYTDELVKWADRWYDTKLSLDAQLGVSEYYKELGENQYEPILKADGSVTNWSDRSAFCPGNDSLSAVFAEDFVCVPPMESDLAKDEVDEMYKPYLPENYFYESWFATSEESDVISNLTTDVFAYFDQMAAEFITKGTADAKWDEYLKNLDNLQTNELLSIFQNIYDRNHK